MEKQRRVAFADLFGDAALVGAASTLMIHLGRRMIVVSCRI